MSCVGPRRHRTRFPRCGQVTINFGGHDAHAARDPHNADSHQSEGERGKLRDGRHLRAGGARAMSHLGFTSRPWSTRWTVLAVAMAVRTRVASTPALSPSPRRMRLLVWGCSQATCLSTELRLGGPVAAMLAWSSKSMTESKNTCLTLKKFKKTIYFFC